MKKRTKKLLPIFVWEQCRKALLRFDWRFVSLVTASILAIMLPAHANDPEPGPPDSLRIGPIDPYWIEAAARYPARPGTNEHRLSSAYPDRILRWGNLLALKLNNERFLWLVDMKGHEGGFGASEFYELQDYWPDQGVYIVGVEFGEHGQHWLISARTARVTKLYAAAYRHSAAPGVFITSGSFTMGSTSAEVWEGGGDAWVRRYKCDYLADDAVFLRWDGPGRAILGASDPQHRSEEFVLAKTNGQWHTNACRAP